MQERIVIKKGSALSDKEIKFMESSRIKEYGENTKNFRKNELDSIFFFLVQDNQIKAFGMLKPVKLYWQDKIIEILGIGNVMSVEKSKGYGRKLMKHINDYLIENNMPSLGDTHKDNYEFYKKCGWEIDGNLINRIIFIDSDEKSHKKDWTDYSAICFDPKGELDSLISSSSDIIIKVPMW